MDQKLYTNHLEILKDELIMALGCTEPIAIAYAAAKARKKKMQKPSRCIYGAQACMKNMHHTSRNSFRISMWNL